MGIAIVTLIVTLTSLMPTARSNFTAATRYGFGRFFAANLALVCICIMGAAAANTLERGAAHIFGVVPTSLVLPLLGLYALLILLAFILPGFAYFHAAQPAGWSAAAHRGRRGPEPERELPPQSAARRTITVTLGSAALAIALLGLLADRGLPFLPSPEHAAFINSQWNHLVIAGSLVCGSWAIVTRLRPGKGPFRNRVLHRVTAVGMCMLGGLMLPPAANTALPLLHALAFPAPSAKQEVIILALEDAHRRKHCSYAATVTWPDAAGYREELCDIPGHIWSTLEPGDHLIVSGAKTAYGLRTSVIYRP
jgi:hypothetical protein